MFNCPFAGKGTFTLAFATNLSLTFPAEEHSSLDTRDEITNITSLFEPSNNQHLQSRLQNEVTVV